MLLWTSPPLWVIISKLSPCSINMWSLWSWITLTRTLGICSSVLTRWVKVMLLKWTRYILFDTLQPCWLIPLVFQCFVGTIQGPPQWCYCILRCLWFTGQQQKFADQVEGLHRKVSQWIWFFMPTDSDAVSKSSMLLYLMFYTYKWLQLPSFFPGWQSVSSLMTLILFECSRMFCLTCSSLATISRSFTSFLVM